MLSSIKIKQKNIPGYFSFLKTFGTKLVGVNTYTFFLMIFIYHLMLIFQGLDMNDEGFHVTAYQQIFNDPESVQYTFLFWLTDVIGGSVMKLFPAAGLLGIRIAGAIVSTSTLIVTYQLFKKHISPDVLKLSLLLLALFINNDPKDLYYNNVSAFFYIIVAYFLYTGLTTGKALLIFVSGIFVGLNIFTRLPNLLGLGIGLIIFYYGFCNHSSLKLQFKNFFLFATGSVTAIFFICLLMYSLGHLHLFINAIRQLFSISSEAPEVDDLNGSYRISNIPIQLSKQFAGTISLTISVFSFIILSSFVTNLVKSSQWFVKTSLLLLVVCFAAYFSLSLIKDGILDYTLIDLFTGLSLLASFFILVKEKSNEKKLLCIIGTFILLVHPFGSATGIYFVVPYSLWLTFPFAIDLIAKTKKLSVNVTLLRRNNNSDLSVSIPENTVQLIKTAGLIIILLTCLNQIMRYPYFCDRHSRIEMTSSVNNKYMKGIFTSKGRTEAINELLEESSKYIHPDDYVLAYDIIPMFHYWTETRPYVRNPSPWFYSSTVFKSELNLAVSKRKPLPVVITQSIRTIGNGSKWPEEIINEDYSKWERNKGRNAVFSKFLLDYNYKIVWENKIFKILLPGEKKVEN